MSDAVHRQHYNVTFALLAMAAVAYALLQSLVAPALLTIQHDLDTTTTGAAWILTAYLLSASVMTPIAGRLGDMFGKKRTLVTVLVVLALGTALAGLATSIGVMIVARVIQGAGGAVFPLAFAIIRDEFPRERVPHGIALISAIMGIGGGLGIVLAGPIVEHLSYHWLFWFPLIAVVVATLGTLFFVPESPIKTPGRVDWLGAVLLAGWLVALLVPRQRGAELGLDVAAHDRPARAVGRAARRLGPGRVRARGCRSSTCTMMRLPPVWTTNLAAFVFGYGMFASFVLVPQFVELPTSTGFGFGASVTRGRALHAAGDGRRCSSRARSPAGCRAPSARRCRCSSARSSRAFAFVILAFAHTAHWEIYVAMLVMGVGIGFAFASMANLIVESVDADADRRRDRDEHDRPLDRRGDRKPGRPPASSTATVASTGLPTERGFTIAFASCAVALAVAFVVALRIPAPVRVAAREEMAQAA